MGLSLIHEFVITHSSVMVVTPVNQAHTCVTLHSSSSIAIASYVTELDNKCIIMCA